MEVQIPEPTSSLQRLAVVAQLYSQPKRIPWTQLTSFLPSSLSMPNAGKNGGATIEVSAGGATGGGTVVARLSWWVWKLMGIELLPLLRLSLSVQCGKNLQQEISLNAMDDFERGGIMSFLSHILQKKLVMKRSS